MKFRELSEKKDEDLMYELGVLQEKWRRLREAAIAKTLKTVHQIGSVKRDLARIRTILRTRKQTSKII